MCRTPIIFLLAALLVVQFGSERIGWSQVEPLRQDALKRPATKTESPATNDAHSKTPIAAESDQVVVDMEAELKKQVDYLATTIGERNLRKHKALCQAADYVESELNKFGYQATRQKYKVHGLDCFNISAEIKGTDAPDEIVIIGGHYDSVTGCPGANDNGSGTAAMLVLAQRFRKYQPQRTLRFVAFTNEEPPYFQTRDQMGSWVYAERCRKENQNIIVVLSLETMGYFTDKPDSQHYPAPLDRLYPSTGNFIGFVSNVASAEVQRELVKSFKANCEVPCESAALPDLVPGVGWSDHWSFWQEGYRGIMVTDTAPYRYPHYHEKTDTPGKMNFPVFAKVVEGLVEPIKHLTNKDTLGKKTDNRKPRKPEPKKNEDGLNKLKQ
jgi:hypothetical protein